MAVVVYSVICTFRPVPFPLYPGSYILHSSSPNASDDASVNPMEAARTRDRGVDGVGLCDRPCAG